ncbi:MAG: hypothetical protein H0U75_07625 [Legionella sp.]|nr:hypothetical protein [Legionella sp.]
MGQVEMVHPNWSQETFLQLKIKHQNYIISGAILEYSNRIANAPKESKDASQAHEALSCLLENRTSLLITDLYSVILTGRYQLPCQYHPGTTKPHYITVLAEYLKQNRSLRELSFNGSEIGRDAACYMLEALQSHPTIEILDMRGYEMHKIGDSKPVCQFIEKNKSVKELFINNLYFDKEIAILFEDALTSNHTLVKLEVAGTENNYLFKKINELLERNRQIQAVTSERQTSETSNTKVIIDILLPLRYDLGLVTDIFTSVEDEVAAPGSSIPEIEVKKRKLTEQDALDDLISAGFTI